MPVPAPPAELPEEVLTAFHQMSTDSPTHLEFNPQREADQRRSNIKQEGHIKQEENTAQEENIAQEVNIKQNPEPYDDYHISYTTLIYQSSAPPTRTGWYFATLVDLDRARKLGPTKLPRGQIQLLRASDIHTMRRAGNQRVHGIAVVFFDGGFDGEKTESEGSAERYA